MFEKYLLSNYASKKQGENSRKIATFALYLQKYIKKWL